MPRALATDGVARVFAGRAIVSDGSCPCCDGCPLWRLLQQCNQSPTDCVTTPPPPMQIWICADVTCTNGEPLAPGMVVKIDQFCFTVTNTTSTNPVGTLLLSRNPVPCVEDCNDPLCPQGELYWPATPCAQVNDEEPDIIWVCGVPPGCHIRGCIIVDGGLTPIPYESLPPGANLARFIDLGPSSTNCCECLMAVPCVSNDLMAFDPDTEPCVTELQRPCCCHFVNGEPSTTYRITRATTHQIVERPAFPSVPEDNGTVTHELIDDCDLTATVFSTGLGRTPEVITGTPDIIQAACFRRCPGGWPARAPRITKIDGIQYLIGFPGTYWNDTCEGFDDGFQRLEVLKFSSFYSCRVFRQEAVYRLTQYSVPGDPRIFTTRFEFTGEITGPNACEDCTSEIGGGVPMNAGEPEQSGPYGAGCAGCGGGQRRTPA